MCADLAQGWPIFLKMCGFPVAQGWPILLNLCGFSSGWADLVQIERVSKLVGGFSLGGIMSHCHTLNFATLTPIAHPKTVRCWHYRWSY